jgi:transcriptional regulator with XRE-family HTH domain
MGRSTKPLTPSVRRVLAQLGGHIRLARLRRHFSAATTAERARLSLPTLREVERGSPKVALGSYASVLQVLGLENDLLKIALDDELGRRLQDAEIDTKRRAPKRALTNE